MVGQIHNQHIGGGDTKGHASYLPIQLRDDLVHSLGSTRRNRNAILGPSAIMPQLRRGANCSILGGHDGMDCAHEPIHNAKVVVDDLGRGGKKLAVQEALMTILRELSYLGFMLITNLGVLTEGAEMITFLTLPFMLAPVFSKVMKTPVVSTNIQHWDLTPGRWTWTFP